MNTSVVLLLQMAIFVRAVMKRKYLVLFTVLFVCCSCAQQRGIVHRIWERTQPGGAMFDRAEQKYQDADYSDALSLYSQYVDQYPKSSLAPAALMKIGMIHAEQKAYKKARTTYYRVIREYPDSYFAHQVYGEILRTYYRQGRFRKVVAVRKNIPVAQLSREQRIDVDLVEGEALMAMKKPFAAYHSFVSAYAVTSGSERARVAAHLKAAIARMKPKDIAAELQRLDGRPPAAYLLYQQGVNDLAAGRIKEAIATFVNFISRFPHHEYADKARQEIAKLKSATYFKGHTIGCLLPLSGRYQVVGQKALKGIELAMVEFGRNRSVNPPVQILIRDTGSKDDQAVQAVSDLADKGVAAIVGPILTAPAAAAAAQKAGVPIITLTQQADIADIGDDVFRNFMTPEMQVRSLLAYTTQALGLNRFAVLYPDETYGKTFMQLFTDGVKNDGKTVAEVEAYDPHETDFSGPIKKVVKFENPSADGSDLTNQQPGDRSPASVSTDDKSAASNPDEEVQASGENADAAQKNPQPVVDFDALFIPDSPEKAGSIISQLQYYDVHGIYLLGTNLWHSEKLMQVVGGQIRHAIICDGFFARSRRPDVVTFVRDFKKTFGYTPGFIEAIGYDSAMMLFKTITRPDVTYRSAVQAALINMPPYDGVTGETTFDKNGDAKKSLYLLKVVGNHFEEIHIPKSPAALAPRFSD